MKTIYEVIKKPLLTEKSLILRDEQNKYSFVVAKNASKGEIVTAVEKFFNVTVEKINTCAIKGKVHRMGRFAGKRADYKKAVVTLKKGDKIDVVEATAK
ncbi:Ribosomal protein L25/L23 [Elusimicrobium minutum Pei191]|uniref:Large ribosomal subunit protein uL23 n=1 Tax=Elusimicrobium minutum (strain Pei191) TaxID=445932 RepID=B2KEL9_ELUMP|nr:50S ribosomal protein L23 [Elusimicrobium minutum]ACC98965.1 Ribosomal protein L25/L23 [Elusimicrobium minutum Pei191]